MGTVPFRADPATTKYINAKRLEFAEAWIGELRDVMRRAEPRASTDGERSEFALVQAELDEVDRITTTLRGNA